MKSDSNTEMELLLRRHARRRSTLVPGAGDAASRSNEMASDVGTHLDADEMNAYAEGELPAGARAHMLAHLADCDRCRALVTNLTLAANVPLKDPETVAERSTAPKRSWREWLALLFAPPVIRYGVPALVAICVVGVAFLAMRQREEERQSSEPTLVARNNEQPEAQTASANKSETSPPLPATNSSPAPRTGEEQPAAAQSKDAQTAQNNPASADTQTTARAKEANDAPPLGTTKAAAPAASSTTVITSEQPRQEAGRDQRDEDLAAAAPRPAAPPPAVSQSRAGETTETDKLNRNRKDSGPSDDRAATSGVVSTTSAREAEEKRAEKTASLAKPARSTEARRRAAPRNEVMTDSAEGRAGGGVGERSNETRSVGGRKFRRQGGAWVDTAYATGRATVNVTRGSEQYRALVADEPGLRAIADQLGGELIVVWRGRAYRIH